MYIEIENYLIDPDKITYIFIYPNHVDGIRVYFVGAGSVELKGKVVEEFLTFIKGRETTNYQPKDA